MLDDKTNHFIKLVSEYKESNSPQNLKDLIDYFNNQLEDLNKGTLNKEVFKIFCANKILPDVESKKISLKDIINFKEPPCSGVLYSQLIDCANQSYSILNSLIKLIDICSIQDEILEISQGEMSNIQECYKKYEKIYDRLKKLAEKDKNLYLIFFDLGIPPRSIRAK